LRIYAAALFAYPVNAIACTSHSPAGSRYHHSPSRYDIRHTAQGQQLFWDFGLFWRLTPSKNACSGT
jgi:hypothetical protein